MYTLKKLDNDQSFLFKKNNTLFLLIKQYLLTKDISNLNQTDLYFCKEIKLINVVIFFLFKKFLHFKLNE